MSDMKMKQVAQIKKDDPLPMLSLNPTKDQAQKDQKTDNAESEKLWKRSLDFFEQMKTASNN